jgi:hypothetical protein
MTNKPTIDELLGMDLDQLPNVVISLESISEVDPDPLIKEVITFLHSSYLLGGYPKIKKVYEEYPDLQNLEKPEEAFKRINATLERRDLPPYEITFKKSKTLDPKFVAACGVLSDFSNKKSMVQKLKTVGMTTAQWNNMLKIKLHREYWERITHDVLDFGVYHEGKLALARNVADGDLPSIKYLNELTGKFTQKQDFDPRIIVALMSGVLDIISRHVDGETARAVADDLEIMAVQQLGIGPGT